MGVNPTKEDSIGVVKLFWKLVLVEARRQNFDVRWVGIHEELEVFVGSF
jgi:hypothetical protein